MSIPAILFGRAVVTTSKTSIEKNQRIENKVWRYLLGKGGYPDIRLSPPPCPALTRHIFIYIYTNIHEPLRNINYTKISTTPTPQPYQNINPSKHQPLWNINHIKTSPTQKHHTNQNINHTKTSTTPKHQPLRKIDYTKTSTTANHQPHWNINHIKTSTTQKHHPHQNINHTKTSTTPKHQPHFHYPKKVSISNKIFLKKFQFSKEKVSILATAAAKELSGPPRVWRRPVAAAAPHVPLVQNFYFHNY